MVKMYRSRCFSINIISDILYIKLGSVSILMQAMLLMYMIVISERRKRKNV